MPENARSAYRAPNWLMLVLGIWLFISPWVIAATGGIWSWNAWAVGVLVVISSFAALSRVAEWEEWINLILGIWLFVSPWVLGFAGNTVAAWDSFLVGVAIVLVAIWGIVAARQIVRLVPAPRR